MPELELDYAQLLQIAREPVESSNIASTGFDHLLQVITIEFHTGDVYAYLGCNATEHTDLRNAESVGKFFNQNIKKAKRTVKLT